jgi:hypothetical protein
MIAGPVERDARFEDTPQILGERLPSRIEDGDLVQTSTKYRTIKVQALP